MLIEYDEVKNQKNIRKHKISFLELATIFSNPFIEPITDIPDLKHSSREKRYHAYGWTSTGFYVLIWDTYRGDRIRIIGGRKMTQPQLIILLGMVLTWHITYHHHMLVSESGCQFMTLD